jgi:hypothetical protein
MPVILRKGKDWCQSSDGPVVDCFHAIARPYGSDARWLCQTCVLVTDNHEEPIKNFPYEQWREMAVQQPGSASGGA